MLACCRTLTLAIVLISLTPSVGWTDSNAIKLSLRSQVKDTSQPENAFRNLVRDEAWTARQTAVIVCDMWDSHHCYRAVQRENQMVPRMDSLLSTLRMRGATVIHAPSSCMAAYQDHPARQRVLEVPKVTSPEGINSWCHSIPAEESATYPIDQSDGGEDDTPEEHAAWAEKLEAQGLNPKAPWTRQHAGLTIDQERDFISDRGDEVWNILQAQNIENVILVGVHTNMCVLGRPFGLRQLAKNGVNVVLMRDLTDTMYNPQAWPHVSHSEGTALIISHIERHVCPTITSDQILGGTAFAFTHLP
jgi:nicotinamidase-related amidase